MMEDTGGSLEIPAAPMAPPRMPFVRRTVLLKDPLVQEQVQVQQDIIDAQHEDVEDINEELAAILVQLRSQRGLPQEDPYVSPLQEHHVQLQEQDMNQEQAIEREPTEAPEQQQEQQQQQQRRH